jgi:hypothetical protein
MTLSTFCFSVFCHFERETLSLSTPLKPLSSRYYCALYYIIEDYEVFLDTQRREVLLLATERPLEFISLLFKSCRKTDHFVKVSQN